MLFSKYLFRSNALFGGLSTPTPFVIESAAIPSNRAFGINSSVSSVLFSVYFHGDNVGPDPYSGGISFHN